MIYIGTDENRVITAVYTDTYDQKQKRALEQKHDQLLEWDFNVIPRMTKNPDDTPFDTLGNLIPNMSKFNGPVQAMQEIVYLPEFTEEEIQTAIDDQFEIMRLGRNDLLSKSDWTQVPDVSISDSDAAAWLSYRQELRDLPSNTTNPFIVTWPEKPV